jgi:hypothetical protein
MPSTTHVKVKIRSPTLVDGPGKACYGSNHRNVPAPPMPTAKAYASTILAKFEQAQTDLVGKAVILTDGKAGTVENLWLDEFHGLRISIKGHEGKWPVSTIKLAQS